MSADALGSVRQLYDSAGQVVANRRYEPFGSLLSASGTGESIYGFAGEQLDASTGLVYLRARYLDTDLGRFTQVDPSAWEAKPYLYAGANPASYTDPTGLWLWAATSSWQHELIEYYYMLPDVRNRQVEYRLPTTHQRPDMFSSLSGEVYEVEPRMQQQPAGHGAPQAAKYAFDLNVAAQLGVLPNNVLLGNWNRTGLLGIGYHLGGRDWPGRFTVEVPGGIRWIADRTEPGLIEYWVEPRLPVEALLIVPFALRQLLRPPNWNPLRGGLAEQPVQVISCDRDCRIALVVIGGAVVVVAIVAAILTSGGSSFLSLGLAAGGILLIDVGLRQAQFVPVQDGPGTVS